MNMQFIISPISGAVIGYFTNWLAIKMLFRPHREYKFPKTNITVPFTPGLIPKNRVELAKKVGDTVEKYLLTVDTIASAFSSEDTFAKFNQILDDIVTELKNSSMTVDDVLDKLLNDRRDIVLDNAETFTVKGINAILANETLHTGLSDFITNKVIELCKSEDTVPVIMNLLERLRPVADKKGREFFVGDDFKSFLTKTIEDFMAALAAQQKPIFDYLPENLMPWLRNTAESNMPKLAELLTGLIEQNPALETKLKQILRGIIDENFGRVLGIFINEEKIYENIKKGLFEYIRDAEIQKELTERAFTAAENFLSNDVSYLSVILERNQLSIDELTEKLAVFVSQLFENGLSDKVIDSLTAMLEKDRSFNFYRIIEKAVPDVDEKIYTFVSEKIKYYFTTELTRLTPDFVHKQLQNLRAFNISVFIGKFSDETIAGVKRFVINSIKTILEKGAGYLAASLNVSKMVEDKMNEFGTAEAEEIILSVVNRELNAITIVGGVLGFVIGMLPAVMSALGVN